MITRLCVALAAPIMGIGIQIAQVAKAAESDAAAFYNGLRSNMKMVVGSTAGGGYDSYGRILARHIVRHIPGTPAMITENLPGASGIRATNYVAEQAPRDGSVVTIMRQNFPIYQVLQNLKAVKTDMRDFQWIGSANDDNKVLVMHVKSSVQTLEDMRSRPMVMGATSPRSVGAVMCHVYNTLLGTKLNVVSGYEGMVGIKLAMERGEVAGVCTVGWGDFHSQFGELLTAKRVVIPLQFGVKKIAALPDATMFVEQARNPKEQAVMDFITKSYAGMGKPYATSPGVPADRVAVLRAAFMKTMSDPEFLADAQNMQIQIEPSSGEEIQQLVSDIMGASPDIIQETRILLGIKEGQSIE